AARPAGASFELTALVVFVITPGAVPVMFTLNVQDELAGMLAPVRLMVFVPATAVMVPPKHDPVNPLGVATTSPGISVSLKVTPVNGTALGLAMVKVRVEMPPTVISD